MPIPRGNWESGDYWAPSSSAESSVYHGVFPLSLDSHQTAHREGSCQRENGRSHANNGGGGDDDDDAIIFNRLKRKVLPPLVHPNDFAPGSSLESSFSDVLTDDEFPGGAECIFNADLGGSSLDSNNNNDNARFESISAKALDEVATKDVDLHKYYESSDNDYEDLFEGFTFADQPYVHAQESRETTTCTAADSLSPIEPPELVDKPSAGPSPLQRFFSRSVSPEEMFAPSPIPRRGGDTPKSALSDVLANSPAPSQCNSPIPAPSSQRYSPLHSSADLDYSKFVPLGYRDQDESLKPRAGVAGTMRDQAILCALSLVLPSFLLAQSEENIKLKLPITKDEQNLRNFISPSVATNDANNSCDTHPGIKLDEDENADYFLRSLSIDSECNSKVNPYYDNYIGRSVDSDDMMFDMELDDVQKCNTVDKSSPKAHSSVSDNGLSSSIYANGYPVPDDLIPEDELYFDFESDSGSRSDSYDQDYGSTFEPATSYSLNGEEMGY